ncbi:AdoMet-dependent tRNA methyltransferase complex subunit [Monosporozyma unispora]|nr:AdoMet-dependent tRNA methyltransferase complex subunit [Kazachstania unispora]
MVQMHLTFRRAELESLADLYNIKINLDSYDEQSPFLILDLENDKQAQNLVKRSILCKAIYEYWGEGENYDKLHENIQNGDGYEGRKLNCKSNTFKFEFESFGGNHKKTMKDKINTINQFAYLELDGEIDLKNAQDTYTLIETYDLINSHETSKMASHIYFGRLIQRSDRSAMDVFDLKKRPYKGTTSFESELSLVSCNIAQVKPGTIMYDPFAGTGSFLVAGGYYGALVMGSDIDGRMIRGKGASYDITENFKYYKMEQQFLDVMTMDFTHNSLRSNLIIDTILCDPPYGIRESIKVLGARDPTKFEGKEDIEINGEKAFLRKDYIPTKKPYSLDSLLDDILQFASERLPINGRLAFWMPTANDENVETIIPLHENLELKYDCVQEFNKWSRRLLVYINRGDEFNGPENHGTKRSTTNFRDRYFTNFN